MKPGRHGKCFQCQTAITSQWTVFELFTLSRELLVFSFQPPDLGLQGLVFLAEFCTLPDQLILFAAEFITALRGLLQLTDLRQNRNGVQGGYVLVDHLRQLFHANGFQAAFFVLFPFEPVRGYQPGQAK